MNQWDSKVNGYCSELEVRKLSEAYLKATRSELNRLGNWLKAKKPKPRLEEINVDHLRDFMKVRAVFKSKPTTYGILSRIRGFGDFLVREGVWKRNPAKWMKGPKIRPFNKLPQRISEEGIEKILSMAIGLRGEYQQLLWTTIILVLYGTGLRRGELERLDLSDWDRDSKHLKIDGQKTGRERIVPVSQVVYDALESYVPHRRTRLAKSENEMESALFVGAQGQRVLGTSVTRIVKGLAKKAGIDQIRIHQFRHTCASHLMSKGVELHKIREILGHSCIQSTSRYAHVSDPERKDAMNFHPINDILGGLS